MGGRRLCRRGLKDGQQKEDRVEQQKEAAQGDSHLVGQLEEAAAVEAVAVVEELLFQVQLRIFQLLVVGGEDRLVNFPALGKVQGLKM